MIGCNSVLLSTKEKCMNTVKIKMLAQQVSDAAQAIMALECVCNDEACGYLISVHKEQLKKYAEALHEEINCVA